MTSSVASSEAPVVRTYGNWRRARGFGIGSWTTAQTVTVFVAICIPLFLFYINVLLASAVLLVSVLVMAVVLVPVGGSSLWMVAATRARFSSARRKGWTEHSGGVLTDHPRKHDLPGPMGPMVPLDTDDGRGGRQVLLWDRRAGLLTVVLRCSPIGLDLADQAQADQWVACWAAWLADLGYQPLVRWISVCVDTAPSGGATLADYVTHRQSPTAPPVAQQVMGELLAATPEVTADASTHVAVTFDPSRAASRPKDLLAAVGEVSRWIPGLEEGLRACGVAVLGRASVPWLTGWLRVAYDPASRGDIALLDDRQQVLAWRDASPVRASETWEYWRHDSGVSVSWAWREAPRQAVTEQVLASLLAPGQYPRRVVWLYEPFPADAAAQAVEQEITNLSVRQEWSRRTRRDTTQRDIDDSHRAQQAAREEAQGAGVGSVSLYVTTTVTDPDLLPAAVADVELRAGQAKLRLRRLWGAQSAGFAGGLGMGLNLVELERRHAR